LELLLHEFLDSHSHVHIAYIDVAIGGYPNAMGPV
jgi:hypothetical protein